MRPPDQDLAARRPVWEALSELYLDTELADADYDRMARVAAASPYSLDQLDHIVLLELNPILWTNVYAWVWAGFDQAWLEQSILARHARRIRWPAAWTWKGFIKDAWLPIRARVAALRKP